MRRKIRTLPHALQTLARYPITTWCAPPDPQCASFVREDLARVIVIPHLRPLRQPGRNRLNPE